MTLIPGVACSRLRDGGGKSFSNKKCEKRAGAGERQGGFPESCASYFRFTRFNTFPLYYLRAWHRLSLGVLAYMVWRGCAAGRGMAFDPFSVLNGVNNFV